MQDDQPERPAALPAAIDVLRRRWSPAILRALSDQPAHYLALYRRVPGISQKVLTQHLRVLERAGVIRRDSQSDRTRVYYALTERGVALRQVMDLLHNWDDYDGTSA